MLEIDSLSVLYGRHQAVRNASLTVDDGRAVGLIGPNGAGKSTLIKAVFGLVKAAEGDIRFDGRSLLNLSPEQIARRGLALVPEGRHIFTGLSVKENLLLGATVKRGGPTREDLEEQLNRFPILRQYLGKTAGLLSGGEQQQLAIARALISRPSVVILDEPSLGLAPQVIDLVFQTLGQLRAEGVTILLSEQNAVKTLAFADNSFAMQSGTVTPVPSMSGSDDWQDIIAGYLGTPTQHGGGGAP